MTSSNKLKSFVKRNSSELIITGTTVVVLVGIGMTYSHYAAKHHRSYVRYLNQKGKIWTEGQNILIEEIIRNSK